MRPRAWLAVVLVGTTVWIFGTSYTAAEHIPGATYSGTVSPAGTISLAVTADGRAVTQLAVANVPGNTCHFTSVTFSGTYAIGPSDHFFSTGGAESYVRGSFAFVPGSRAQGTLRLVGGGPPCDSGILSWTATTSALPPPPPPAPPPAADYGCRVPRVIGKTLPRAKRAIRRAGCIVGRVRRTRSSKPRGRVIAQSPPPRTFRYGGARVHLVVSRGRR